MLINTFLTGMWSQGSWLYGGPSSCGLNENAGSENTAGSAEDSVLKCGKFWDENLRISF